MSASGDGLSFDTLAVHAGEGGVDVAGARPTATPIVHASSFWYESIDELDRVLGGEQPGYSYARYASPTVRAFEQAIAALEGAPDAVAFGSGMAALYGALQACASRPGDVVFASQDCYGGTYTLLTNVVMEQGIQVRFVDVYDVEQLEARIQAERPRALVLEVISNPLERVADLRALGDLVRRRNVELIVDSTFTSPYLVRPLEFGASYAVHSATKYLGGHGDVTAGVVACSTAEQAAELHTLCKLTGAILGPAEASLALRGIKTLALRMERQCANAAAIAGALARDARVERVYYPGLPDDPDHALAARLFRNGTFGAMLAFAIRGARKSDVMRLMERLRLIRPAPTLGDVCTLALYPVIASHRGLTPEQRGDRGIHDNVLRLSAGIEDARDLIADLDQALAGGQR